MNAKEARYLSEHGMEVYHDKFLISQAVCKAEARGYLAALEGEEVKALVKAMEKAHELSSAGCPDGAEETLEYALAAFKKAVQKP